MKDDYRPRLSIVLDEELKDRLDKLLGEWRIKNALFEAITRDLCKVMERMNDRQRRVFIVAIVEGHLKPEEYLTSVRKAINV